MNLPSAASFIDFPYDAVLFDLDGTLTRSQEGIFNCARYALEKMGWEIPGEEVLRRFIGPPLFASFRDLTGMNDAQCRQAIVFYRERYETAGMYENAVYPGIRRLLKALRDRGAYLAVVTGKPQRPTEAILQHFGLAKFFHAVAGTRETDTEGSKRRQIGLAMPEGPRRTVLVGDSPYDIMSAREAGLNSVAVTYGYGDKSELMAAGPTHAVDSVAELTSLLCPGAKAERGYFLSVEGLDGSGKTTQADLLEKQLRDFGFEVLRTREPGGCPISEKIRSVVLDRANAGMSAACEALLYAASRAQHVFEVIRPAVANGKLVLCDRFVDSSIAYQGGGRELGVETVAQINAPAVGGLMPDLTVYLDIGHEQAIRRRQRASDLDRIEIEQEAFHARVEAAYRRLIRENGERYVVVDGREDPQRIAAEVFSRVLERLSAREA